MVSDLGAAFARARTRWPQLELDFDRFVRFVTPKLDQQPQAWEDLALVDACCRDVPGSVELLEKALRLQVHAVVRTGAATEDEVSQRLLEKLLVGPTPRLSSFSGRGSLSGWLRAAVVREVLNLNRGANGTYTDDQALESAAQSGTPVDLQVLRARHADAFKAAFREALSTLTEQQRELVRLHLIENVSLSELSRRWSVHRTTLARWLDLARHHIALATRERLNQTLQLSKAEFDSLVNFLQQQVEVSLTGLNNP